MTGSDPNTSPNSPPLSSSRNPSPSPRRPPSILDVVNTLDPHGSTATTPTPPPPPSRPRDSSTRDRETARARAIEYLKDCDPGIQGNRGESACLWACRVVVWGFDLGEDEGYDLLAEHYNPKCDPVFTEPQLRRKCNQATDPNFKHPRGWLLAAERERPPLVRDPSRPVPTFGPMFDPPPTDAPPLPSDPLAEPVAAPPESAGQSLAPLAGLPSIVQQPAQLRDVINDALAAIRRRNNPPTLFVHGQTLIAIDPEPAEDAKPLRTLTKPSLRLHLAHCANWLTELSSASGDKVVRPVFPKAEVVESLLEHHEWPGVPRLRAVADVPVYTKFGTLVSKPGYDPASGIYLMRSGCADLPPIHPCPPAHQVEEAKRLILDELLGDFPFAGNASRANALGLFLLPFVRDLIDGPTPLHHIDAPQEGTGKSLFAETWGVVTMGREPQALAEVTKPDDWQKLILAALIEAPREIYLDNINQTLDSGALASSLTASAISGRLLGFSRMVSAPVRCVWVSTANNLRMSRELVRRTVYVRLDAGKDAAWNGRQFKHQLPIWAKVNRGQLAWACLTLCQSWVSAGMPAGRSMMGKFEAWSQVIDGILSHVGVSGFLGNADSFRASAVDRLDEWRPFVAAWWEAYRAVPVGVSELFNLATLNDLLDKTLGDGRERSQRTRLGAALNQVRDRMFGTIRLIRCGEDDKSGRGQYQLIDTAQTEEAGE